jgi:hypothetical protein
MLSGRLVRMIEDHAEQLTRGLMVDLKQNPRTSEYHNLSDEEIHRRVYDVYHDLGEWLGSEGENFIRTHYSRLGKQRAIEGVPLSQVLYALIRTKAHLFDYVRTAGLIDSAVDLYQLQELRRLVDNFFDKAVYYTTCAYEREAPVGAPTEVAGGVS